MGSERVLSPAASGKVELAAPPPPPPEMGVVVLLGGEVEPLPEPEPESLSEPESEPLPESEPESLSEPEPEPLPESESEPLPEPEPESLPDPESVLFPAPEPIPDPEPEPDEESPPDEESSLEDLSSPEELSPESLLSLSLLFLSSDESESALFKAPNHSHDRLEAGKLKETDSRSPPGLGTAVGPAVVAGREGRPPKPGRLPVGLAAPLPREGNMPDGKVPSGMRPRPEPLPEPRSAPPPEVLFRPLSSQSPSCPLGPAGAAEADKISAAVAMVAREKRIVFLSFARTVCKNVTEKFKNEGRWPASVDLDEDK